ncbi:MAG: DUF4388 domain-containing protein [Candidatus Aminicenantes bacterium]|nr:DUF4388 domain-containing protein [Candidatus Aminicenantes bacterium]
MEKFWLHGTLENTSLAQLLFRIWRSKRSGSLEIKNPPITEKIDFINGDVLASRSSFPKDSFLIYLKKFNLIKPNAVDKCNIYAKDKSVSQITALIEMQLVTASDLWDHMQNFLKYHIQPMFDWDEAEFFFDSEHPYPEEDVLISLSTLDLILEATRKMENFKLMNRLIPEENATLEILYPAHFNQLRLDLSESYLFQIIQDKKNLGEIVKVSELGEKETKKRIYRLLALGVLGLPKDKYAKISHQELTQADLLRIINAFNEKCIYIFRYLSKEIGPVALNLLKKTLDDTRIHLPPQLRHIALDNDGKMRTDSILKINPVKASDKDSKEVLRGLNEILAAEMLTVKKALGNEHESILIKSLQKAGEWK